MSTHEDIKRELEVKGSSDRSFGLVFAAVFFIIAIWPLFFGGQLRWWAIGFSLVFVVFAMVAPHILTPLNIIWTKFGLLLGKIVNPIILGIMFFIVITPIACFMRLTGKDFLRMKSDESTDSYWIKREPPGPLPDSMPQQF